MLSRPSLMLIDMIGFENAYLSFIHVFCRHMMLGIQEQHQAGARHLSAAAANSEGGIQDIYFTWIGKTIKIQQSDDDTLYEATITSFNPNKGLHAVKYQHSKKFLWLNLIELPKEDINWDNNIPILNLRKNDESGHGEPKSMMRGAIISSESLTTTRYHGEASLPPPNFRGLGSSQHEVPPLSAKMSSSNSGVKRKTPMQDDDGYITNFRTNKVVKREEKEGAALVENVNEEVPMHHQGASSDPNDSEVPSKKIIYWTWEMINRNISTEIIKNCFLKKCIESHKYPIKNCTNLAMANNCAKEFREMFGDDYKVPWDIPLGFWKVLYVKYVMGAHIDHENCKMAMSKKKVDSQNNNNAKAPLRIG